MRLFTTILATTTLALASVPALAQQEPEEPRTTYAVSTFQFEDDADQERWLEIVDTYINPARVAAGMAPETVHWVMVNPDVDIMIVAEMPDGMGGFDHHMTPTRAAFVAALTNLVGGEEQLAAMRAEMDGMTKNWHVMYTHTHP
ncbi:MAG: hypothetical protein KDE15_02430 [Erythrobacter sp.]|nr:hypothetical protein [Erythrobacter sp.]